MTHNFFFHFNLIILHIAYLLSKDITPKSPLPMGWISKGLQFPPVLRKLHTRMTERSPGKLGNYHSVRA